MEGDEDTINIYRFLPVESKLSNESLISTVTHEETKEDSNFSQHLHVFKFPSVSQ